LFAAAEVEKGLAGGDEFFLEVVEVQGGSEDPFGG